MRRVDAEQTEAEAEAEQDRRGDCEGWASEATVCRGGESEVVGEVSGVAGGEVPLTAHVARGGGGFHAGLVS